MESIKQRMLDRLDRIVNCITFNTTNMEVVTLNSTYYDLKPQIFYQLSVQIFVEKDFIGKRFIISGIKIENIHFLKDDGTDVRGVYTNAEVKNFLELQIKDDSYRFR